MAQKNHTPPPEGGNSFGEGEFLFPGRKVGERIVQGPEDGPCSGGEKFVRGWEKTTKGSQKKKKDCASPLVR